MIRRMFIVVFACGVCASSAFAQQVGQGAVAAPPEPAAQPQHSTLESRLKASVEWIGSTLETGKRTNGFYPELRGLPPGSGISAGPGFRHGLFDGRALVDASAAVSWSRGRYGQVAFELPRLAGEHVDVGTQVKWQDFTRVSYFGVGPSSLDANRTEYGLKDTDYNAFATLKAHNWLTIGGRVGFSQHVNIGRSNSTNPSTEDLFTEATAPGLFEHPAFLHGEVSINVDTRSHPFHPTSGGDYRVTFSTFNDRDFDRYSFHRLEAEASQFIPILHENWVIALRGRIATSDTASGNVVPFYLLPTFGGSTSLRGYDDYRFRDRNLVLLNAEYRWTVFGALDGALFYDAGNVAPRFGDLDLNQLRTSYGVGLRFHSDKTTFLRIDVGHGNEGTRLFLSLTEALKPGHGSIFIPYMP